MVNQNGARRSSTEFASTEELIATIGPRAAEVINESHCALEDELAKTQAVLSLYHQRLMEANYTIGALSPHIQRYKAMEQLMSDPNRLAAYTVDFFTHVHPLPERPSASQSLVRPDFPQMPAQQGSNDGTNLGQYRPDMRWKIADQLERQGALATKRIIHE